MSKLFEYTGKTYENEQGVLVAQFQKVSDGWTEGLPVDFDNPGRSFVAWDLKRVEEEILFSIKNGYDLETIGELGDAYMDLRLKR